MAVMETRWATLRMPTSVRIIAAERLNEAHFNGASFNTERTEARVYTTPDEQYVRNTSQTARIGRASCPAMRICPNGASKVRKPERIGSSIELRSKRAITLE
jgi:hypothetical protein